MPERRAFATAAPICEWGSTARWVTCALLFGNAAKIASPTGLSVRWPCASAHFITALMRRLTRPAVPVFVVQIGSSTAMTSHDIDGHVPEPGEDVVAHRRAPILLVSPPASSSRRGSK